jgi:hypothetical protein
MSFEPAAAARDERRQEPLASNLQRFFCRRLPRHAPHMDYEISGIDDYALPFGFQLRGDLRNLADTLLKVRALRAFDCSARRLPIHRNVRFAARRSLEGIFDDLALRAGLVAHRLDTAALLLDGHGGVR